MKITCLVENTSHTGLKAAHGLSLYVETEKHRILFDLGPDGTIFENAMSLGIDLKSVDTVIISHGHKDHGGALGRFLTANSTARIYIQRSAFEPHYSRNYPDPAYNGLDAALASNFRLFMLDGDTVIDDELRLITAPEIAEFHSAANDVLYSGDVPDSFSHEQSLIIREHTTALIMGCGHTGVVSIMEKAADCSPSLCVGGYHLYNPTTGATVGEELLSKIALQLAEYSGTQFYTCHCTGSAAYEYLSQRLSNMHYLSCGDHIGA